MVGLLAALTWWLVICESMSSPTVMYTENNTSCSTCCVYSSESIIMRSNCSHMHYQYIWLLPMRYTSRRLSLMSLPVLLALIVWRLQFYEIMWYVVILCRRHHHHYPGHVSQRRSRFHKRPPRQNCRQFVARLLLDTKGYKLTVA